MKGARAAEACLLFGLYAIPVCVPWTVAGIHIAAALAAAGAVAVRATTGRWPLRRTPADIAMLAFAAACILATARSAEPAASFVNLKKLLLLPLVNLAAGALTTPARARTLLRLHVAALGVAALAATIQFALLPHAVDARLRGTGHYMTFAGLLLLGLPLAAAAVATTRGALRAAYAAASAVLGAALLLTFTRSAWIGAVAAAILLVLRARPRLVLLVPVAVALGLVAMPAAYRERALSSFDPGHPHNVDRVRLWRAGWAMWREHAWTGVGLVDLKPYYLRYRADAEGHVHGHLHDNALHVLATTGVVGLAAFVWLMVGLGRAAYAPGRRAATGAELCGLRHGIWGVYGGFQVMGLFEWNFGDVEVTIPLYVVLGAGIAAAALASAAERGSGTPDASAGSQDPRVSGRAAGARGEEVAP